MERKTNRYSEKSMRQCRAKKSGFLLALLCLFACVFALSACGKSKSSSSSTVTIGYYDGDTAVAEFTGKAGDKIASLGEVPQLPAKTGYAFSQWQTESGEQFTLSRLPDRNVKVYAYYAPVTYSVCFTAGAGIGADTTVTAVYDTEFTVPAAAAKYYRSGYTLTGWSTSDNGVAEFAADARFGNMAHTQDAQVKLYAVYAPKAATEDFIIENGTVQAYVGSASVITLPESATRVADYAFCRNTTLREVTVPASYTHIGRGAFEGCARLEKLTVPFIGGSRTGDRFLAYIFGAATYTDNVFSYNKTGMGTAAGSGVAESSLKGTFFIPRTLRTVILNDRIDEIPEGAFYYAYGLERVIVYPYADARDDYAYRIKTVGARAFEGCHNIGYNADTDTSVRMPWLAQVETFGARSFAGYVAVNGYFGNRLSSVGELTAVKRIEDEAFRYNGSLCDVTLGKTLEYIGDYAFASVSMLHRAVIPDSCTHIGAHAFDGCVYLTSVVIGKNVTEVGDNAFYQSAALNEVFFKGDSLPKLGQHVFEGVDLSASSDMARPQGNDGLAFYFNTQAQADAAADAVRAQCSAADVRVADYEREAKTYYYTNSHGDVDCELVVSAGHTMIVRDPYDRMGIGLSPIVGTYKKEDALYGADVYTLRLLLDYDYTVTLSGNSFTLYENAGGSTVAYTVGDKQTDEWYIEQTAAGQVALYRDGTLVPLEENAVEVRCAITQSYPGDSASERVPRTFVYEQTGADGKAVLAYTFTYVPDKADTKTCLLGTLVQKPGEVLFGEYDAAEGDKAHVSVDSVQNKLTVRVGKTTVASGSYAQSGSFGDATLTLSAITGQTGNDVIVTLSDPIGADGQKFYARCSFAYDGQTYTLYNDGYDTRTEYAYVSNGKRNADDYYILYRYELSDDEYYGCGEHYFKAQAKSYCDVFTYADAAEKDAYTVTVQTRNGAAPEQATYTATFTDTQTFTATVPIAGTMRTYVEYVPEEVGLRFAAGDTNIVFGECGSATFTAADGTGYTGTYAAVSEETVLRIFLSASTYLEMPEYVFRSSDGKFTQYFVPVPYSSYDGSLQAGELLLSDGLRGKTFRLYNENNELTGEFETYGYGLGVLRIFASQDGTVHDSAVAETVVTYDLLREQDGKPLYRLRNDWDRGFFAFVPTDTKTPDGNAWVAETDEVYAEWWRDPAALYVTGVMANA